MLPQRVRQYLLYDLEAGPDVLSRLFAPVTDPAIYDRRLDPERFTLREMLGHLADWEEVFLGRLLQTRDEENATLVGLDEGQIAIDHGYAHADTAECLARYKSGRQTVLELLRGVSADQWNKAATHTEIGSITLEEQVILIAAHDGYHRLQTVGYVSQFETSGT